MIFAGKWLNNGILWTMAFVFFCCWFKYSN